MEVSKWTPCVLLAMFFLPFSRRGSRITRPNIQPLNRDHLGEKGLGDEGRCENNFSIFWLEWILQRVTNLALKIYSSHIALTPAPLPKALGVPRTFGRGEHVIVIVRWPRVQAD